MIDMGPKSAAEIAAETNNTLAEYGEEANGTLAEDVQDTTTGPYEYFVATDSNRLLNNHCIHMVHWVFRNVALVESAYGHYFTGLPDRIRNIFLL